MDPLSEFEDTDGNPDGFGEDEDGSVSGTRSGSASPSAPFSPMVPRSHSPAGRGMDDLRSHSFNSTARREFMSVGDVMDSSGRLQGLDVPNLPHISDGRGSHGDAGSSHSPVPGGTQQLEEQDSIRRHVGKSNINRLPRLKAPTTTRQPQHIDRGWHSPEPSTSGRGSPGPMAGSPTSRGSPSPAAGANSRFPLGGGAGLLSSSGTLPQSLLQLDFEHDDPATSRILSLPNIVCHTAGGDLFIVELDDVQHMLHKRRIGTAGMKVLAKHANSRQTMNERDTKKQLTSAGMVRRRLARPHGVVSTAASASAAMGEQQGGGAEVDSEVARHLAMTSDKTEALRRQLAEEWHKRAGPKSPSLVDHDLARRLGEEEGLRAASTEPVVKAPPRRRSHSVGPHGELKPDSGIFERMQEALSKHGGDAVLPKPVEEEPAEPAHKATMWNKVAGTVKMAARPEFAFLDNWAKTTRKLRHEDGEASGWEKLLAHNDIYVKGKVDVQGATVYVMHCHELGVVPSTQVVQQLGQADSNMSHSKLGRRGAMALRHALAANTTITHLNLANNGFDAPAVAEIMRGLTLGTLANAPAARRQLTLRWQRLQFIKEKPADITINLQPLFLNQEKADVAKSRNPSPRKVCDTESDDETGVHHHHSSAANDDELEGTLPAGASPEGGHHHHHHHGGAAAGAAASSSSPAPSSSPVPPAGMLTNIMCQISKLDLSSNAFGIYGARILAEVMDPAQTPFQFLTVLTADKCGIPELGGIAIFKALMNGNIILSSLSMANNQLGNKTAEVLGEMLGSNRTLCDLNLAWNKIGPEGCKAVSKGLEGNMFLTKLDLSWNGLENPGVRALGSMLCVNRALRHLDLTSTRMGADACLMLSEGIRRNKVLDTLILNTNAVGDDGARHLMNALRANDSLHFLGLQGANMSSAARGNNASALFNPLAPDGSYSLDLHDPSERTVAVQLCTLDRASPHDLMRGIKCDGRIYASCRSVYWPDSLPASGQLTCDFISQRQRRDMRVMDDQKFSAVYSQMAAAGGNMMSDKEKLGLTQVMAPFSYMTCFQIATMLSAFSMCEEQVQCAAVLFTRAVDLAEHTQDVLAALHDNERRSLLTTLGWHLHSRFDNCTGHYELSLSDPMHHHLGIRLKDVACAEKDCNNWNNIIYDTAASTVKFAGNYGPPESWRGLLPTSGTLTLDYTSDETAPPGSIPFDEPALMLLLQQMGVEFDEAGEAVPALDFDVANRQVAHLRTAATGTAYVTCKQIIRIVNCFEYGPHRVEVCVILYARTTDLPQLWTVVYNLRPLEQGLLSWRLGPAAVFDRAHVSMHFILDLGNPSHETVAKQVVAMGVQNSDVLNFWNLRLQGTKRYISENRNLWGTITADTFSPLLEFDFASVDSYEALGRGRAELDAMPAGEKLDLRTKQMKRSELGRIKQMYAYFRDASNWVGPAWQNKTDLFKPHLEKPPWLASWDRLLRVLFRCDLRSGDIDSDSYLEDLYEEFSKGQEGLNWDEFDLMLRTWGYNKAELIHHYHPKFVAAAVTPYHDPLMPEGQPLLNLKHFVAIMMTEPPRRLRLVRDKDAVSGIASVEEPLPAAPPRIKTKPTVRGRR